jgi:hypothetical protein
MDRLPGFRSSEDRQSLGRMASDSLVGGFGYAGFPFGGSRAVERARWVAALWAEPTKSIVKLIFLS